MFKEMFFAASCGIAAAALAADTPAGEAPATEFSCRHGKFTIVGKTSAAGARAEVGDTVKIAVTVKSKEPGFFSSTLFVNGNQQGKEKIVPFGEFSEYSVKTDAPGEVAAHVLILNAEKKPVLNSRKRRIDGGLGVFVSPEKLTPGNPTEPADLDEFWKSKRAELDKVPIREERKEIPVRGKHPELVGYDIKVTCAGDAPVSGCLCLPRDAKPKSLPAVVRFHGAGVRSAYLHPEYGTAAISLDVNAHGIENGKPAKFYKALSDGKLKSYWHRGYDNHENIYFVGMYLRVMRALDYVKSLPEWDGKTLIVCGGSQGGAQTIAAAALDSQVTLAVPGVPALCDLGGRVAKRRPGWPIHFMKPFEKQTDPALIAEAAYVDGVFFARRIKCPVYFSTGGIDNTCHATSVFAAYNAVPGKDGKNKHLLYHPTGDHGSSPSKPGYALIRKIIGLK